MNTIPNGKNLNSRLFTRCGQALCPVFQFGPKKKDDDDDDDDKRMTMMMMNFSLLSYNKIII